MFVANAIQWQYQKFAYRPSYEITGSTKTRNPESGNENRITETEMETERNHGNGIRNPCKKAPSD